MNGKGQQTKYKIGFWNYVHTGKLDPVSAADDWKELGANCTISFDFHPDKHKTQDLMRSLDACAARGIGLIIAHSEASAWHLKQVGRERYIADLRRAADTFARHPAFVGFHMCDEPSRADMPTVAEAVKINLEMMPTSRPFVNFMCWWNDPGFCAANGATRSEYMQAIDAFVVESGIPMIGFDFYAQCAHLNRERGIDDFMTATHAFSDIATKHGIELGDCPLCVGHWMYDTPDEDLLRWQINASVAMGVTSMTYFMLYDHEVTSTFRLSPIDVFGNKTETFGRVARENRIFSTFYAPALEKLTWRGMTEYGERTYGDWARFAGNDLLRSISYVANPVTLAVAEFDDGKGNRSFAVVNLSQTEPTVLQFDYDAEKLFLFPYNGTQLAPGAMLLLLNKATAFPPLRIVY